MIRLIDIANYSEAYADIVRIKMLPYGWDGDKGPSGDDYPVDEALNFLNLLRERRFPVPWVFASKRHSIQFEWDLADKDYLELELYYTKLSLFRITDPEHYLYEKEQQDYSHQDIIFTQIERWNQKLPFLIQGDDTVEET